MKRSVTLLISTAIISLGIFSGCETHVDKVIVNPNTLDMQVGDQKAVTVTVLPDNADNKAVFWRSAHDSVATCANNMVTAHSAGWTNIVCLAEDGWVSDNLKVFVGDITGTYTGDLLDKDSTILASGVELTIALESMSKVRLFLPQTIEEMPFDLSCSVSFKRNPDYPHQYALYESGIATGIPNLSELSVSGSVELGYGFRRFLTIEYILAGKPYKIFFRQKR